MIEPKQCPDRENLDNRSFITDEMW